MGYDDGIAEGPGVGRLVGDLDGDELGEPVDG